MFSFLVFHILRLIFSSKDFFLPPFLSLSGIYGVGKAAEHPPALAVLSHMPEGATQTIAWVGKGIVYDTGGLSIKGKVDQTPHSDNCCQSKLCVSQSLGADQV